jgi:hypothetical protein
MWAAVEWMLSESTGSSRLAVTPRSSVQAGLHLLLVKVILLNPLTAWRSQGRSYITTDSQSVSQYVVMPSRRNHSGTYDQIFLSVWGLLSESCCLVSVGRPVWQEVGSVICHSQSAVIYQYLHQGFTFHLQFSNLYAIYTKLLFVPARYSRLCSSSYY